MIRVASRWKSFIYLDQHSSHLPRAAWCVGVGVLVAIALVLLAWPTNAQTQKPISPQTPPTAQAEQAAPAAKGAPAPSTATAPAGPGADYRIGPDDLLTITVIGAPDLSATVRVSGNGDISMPMLGAVHAAGNTQRQLEQNLEELLKKTYMKKPHVGVYIAESQSHRISVVGSVRKPGVYQVWGDKSLLEAISMAEGLADDAGETVLVMRQSDGNEAAAKAEEISLKQLMGSGGAKFNVPVHAGDVVKVMPAGVVYVVGEVKQPGGFAIKSSERATVLQALALGQGLSPTASKGNAVIIRTGTNGERTEIPVDLNKVMARKAPDPELQAKDILFVPTSGAKSFGRGTLDALVRMITLRGPVIP